MEAIRAALALQKGGVGKTTTTLNTARAAAAGGHRVLVLDADPQANTTGTIAAEPVAADQVTIADAIVPRAEAALTEVLVPTVWPGVTLAPAVTETLTTAETLIFASQRGREHRLTEAVAPLADEFDLMLIDTPPNLGMLSINALAAAHRIVVVTEADQWSADGLAELRSTVDGVQRYVNPHLTWAGVVVNRWRDTRDERELLTEIEEGFPQAPIWPERIPLWSAIKTTLNAGQGLDQSREARLRVLAESYTAIADRIINGKGQP